MGFLDGFFFFLSGGERAAEMESEAVPDPVPGLSSVANSVVYRCSRILALSTEQLVQRFEAELPDHANQDCLYARNLVEYCSYRALHEETKHPDHLADNEFRVLTFDMMLAWETPDTEKESMLNEPACSDHFGAEDDDGGSLFYASATRLATQVDGKRTVGAAAFAKIAPACPSVADPITVHNLFDALTSSSGGRLHFLIYAKYLKSLEKVLRCAKCVLDPSHASILQLPEGEIILDVDGAMPTKPILQHIGTSTWPVTLLFRTSDAYQPRYLLRVIWGRFSYNKAVMYDLAKDLKQVVKRECTGPWGARLFDKAVMYRSSSLAEPIFLEFPQFKGHSRRDYWFAIIKEVLHVHKFIRKYKLGKYLKAEALSEATLGILRYRALKEGFHILPSHFKTTLAFNLAEKLPKGDKILKALNKHLEVVCSDEKPQAGTFPLSVYTLSRMGLLSLREEDTPEERGYIVGDVGIGGTSPLRRAVRESVCYSGRVEVARATLDQVKVKDIDTNLAVIKELLFPCIELGKQLKLLVDWEDPFKSHAVLVLILFIVYRGWIRYILPCIFFSCAAFMLWQKHNNHGKPIDAFEIAPPPSRNPVEQLLTLPELVSKLETNVQAGSIFLLKLRAIMFAAFPQTTNKVAVALIAAAFAFAFVPFKNLLLLVLLEAYTRHMPLRKASSEKLIRRVREWWVRIPAAPVQILKHQESRKLK
uniref:DUF639 domain-containing protein n=1 Tax=Ananas comosus var. bracteatus TaxID=296719 RepID=A0A6V7NR53_ANACO|nr:unnamed protein product [Ananas comosus var. bracteatus]